MSDEHGRHTWFLRRKQDYTITIFLLTMAGGFVTFGVKMVRLHTHVMDQVTEAISHKQQAEKEWHPRIVAVENRQNILETKLTYIIESQKRIENILDRRTQKKSTDIDPLG